MRLPFPLCYFSLTLRVQSSIVHTLSINTLRIYRIVGLVFGLIVLLYPYLVEAEDKWNPLWLHFFISGFVISYTLLSWRVKFIRENFLYFTYAFAFLGCFWMTGLTFANELKINFASFTILTFPIAGAIFRHKRWLWAFFFSQFAFSLALSPLPQEPELPVYLYLLFTAIEMMGISMVMRTIIAERFEMKAKEKERVQRQKELLEVEKELMVEVASASREGADDIQTIVARMAQKTIDVLDASEITVWLLHKNGSFAACSLENARNREKGILGKRIDGSQIALFLACLDRERVLIANGPENCPELAEWEIAVPDFCKPRGLWVPMRPAGSLKGFFAIQKHEGEWTIDEVSYASSMGDVGSMVMETIRRKETEEELVQRNFELDSFVYRASHDLKAPLNSLMGLISLTQMENLQPQVREYLQLMDRSVIKLNTFIEKLNEFSRISRLELGAEKIEFKPLVEDIMESLKYMEGSDRIRIDFKHTGNGSFMADKFHLEIVLSNLLSNAIKYQDYQKEDPYIKVYLETDPKGYVIEVSDNGIGIPKKYQDQLFDLFFRASNQSFGSGLGLYIIKHTLRKLGGELELNSEEGKGTTFRIMLPSPA
jgi:signal transduction histidine kinase